MNDALLTDTLSVVVRSASIARLPMLDEALFSLACQHWKKLDVVLALQAPSAEFLAAAQATLARQPWRDGVSHQVLAVPAAPGFDARARLLSEGAKAARGEFLAFLDDDDIVYQRGYERLIARLRARPDAVLAVGGTRLAFLDALDDYYFIRRKQDGFFAWGSRRFDLFRDNFIPIHSYVLARARLPADVLRFSDEHVPLEDYEFLLRAATIGPFETSERLFPVAEYRIHPGNTIWDGEATDTAHDSALARARTLIARDQKALRMTITRSEWQELQAALSPPPAPAGQPLAAIAAPEHRFLHRRADTIYRLLDRYPRLSNALGAMVARFRRA
ncbi:MAG TPA: glycosyltransferase family A protein [Arenimonas sp.]|uniref:glycosyltransferase family A protein n=1 Tax=Arenimonas sp. TaxID=1872635 RepID=UPI002B983A09|nr:glycosyltransferase family A protein [Arenimonas sp.]HMB55943.1 glycosyltransferase family A protein [Arenimonas sp.]